MNLLRIILNLLVTTALCVCAVTAQTNQTVIVTGDTAAGENQPGWLFNRDTSTSTPYQFDTAKASIGKGSLLVMPITNTDESGNPEPSDKFIAEFFFKQPISSLNSFTYHYVVGSGDFGSGDPNDTDHFYLNVYANFGESDENKFYDCRYNIVPVIKTAVNFAQRTFDPHLSYPVTTRTGTNASPYPCPAVPADMDTYPGNATIRAFAINVGDTSLSDTGVGGFIDNVIVSTTGGTTTYDFEPSKELCKRGGWQYFTSPVFENQGQCISYIQSNGNSSN